MIQDFDAFQCAENSHISVVVPAMWNRINVRTEQNYRQLRITPFSVANDVSRSIDTDFQSCLLHQRSYVFTTLNVGIAECNAAHSPFAICSEFGKLFDSLFHSLRIGSEIFPIGARTENWE